MENQEKEFNLSPILPEGLEQDIVAIGRKTTERYGMCPTDWQMNIKEDIRLLANKAILIERERCKRAIAVNLTNWFLEKLTNMK